MNDINNFSTFKEDASTTLFAPKDRRQKVYRKIKADTGQILQKL